MLSGEIGLTHEAVDGHDVGQATDYLRSWLVSHAILPVRDERLARFDRWSRTTLSEIGGHPDQAHLAAYARWKLRPELVRRLAGPRARPSSHKASYLKLRTAIRLTVWLHQHHLVLGQLRQQLLDEWLADAPSRALPTRDFIEWAHRSGSTPRFHIQRPSPASRDTPMSHPTRLEKARKLLADAQLEPPARIAGCLVLLYGQRVTTIVTLQTSDIIDDGQRLLLRLGDHAIEVADPLGALLRLQLTRTTGPWLFPGAKAGTHLGAERARRRLRQLDIRAESARPGALLALASRVPAPILAELLGYCDDTANHWRRAAGGDWARHASLAATTTS